MTRDRWELLKDIFSKALEQPSELRDDFVQRAVGADSELLTELRRLLSEHDDKDERLSRPAIEAVPLGDGPSQFAAGAVLADRFRIVRFIARGGMGEVYEAEDLILKDRVALKTIRPELAQNADVLEMFKTETQLARKVTHPNVCRIHDFARHTEVLPDGSERSTNFLTMELLGGETLAHYLRQHGALRSEEALPLIEQLAAALRAAHAAGVVHRDLKPGNIMVIPGDETGSPRAVVTDFGMAILAQESTSAGGPYFKGTPGYMAPEQVEGGPVTPATDVYSLALVIAEMIGARRRTAATSRMRSALRLRDAKYERPQITVNESYPGWGAVLERCMERSPEDRYQRPEQVLEALSTPASQAPPLRAAWVGVTVLLVVAAIAARPWRLFSVNQANPVNGPLFVEDDSLQVWSASPDGELLVGTRSDGAGNLVVRNVSDGGTRQLTRESQGAATSARFSRDGRLIVYVWETNVNARSMRVTSVAGDTPKIILDSSDFITIEDWSRDGTRILATFISLSGVARVGWIPAAGGPPTFLAANRGLYRNPRFSADGDSILVSTRGEGAEGASDIARVGLDGSPLASVVAHPSDDVLWDTSPDGQSILFTSDRQGTIDLWSTPVEGGGDARRLWPNIGKIGPFNLSAAGTLFYRMEPQIQEVYTAAIDLEKGEVSVPEKVIPRFRAPTRWPGWSPDGRQLVFVSTSDAATLGLYSVATKQTRMLGASLTTLSRPQWHPSGNWIDVVGTDLQGRQGHFRVDPNTGEASLLISSEDLESGFEGVWSKDGVTTFNRFNQWERGLFRFRSDAKVRQVLYVPPDGVDLRQENLALSPDGNWLAFQIKQLPNGPSNLAVIPATGGEPRVLLSLRNPESFPISSFAWTPDSKAVLATQTTVRGTVEVSRLSKVSLDGGSPVEFRFPQMRVNQGARLSPDGKFLAFTSGREKSEIWKLENLFPR